MPKLSNKTLEKMFICSNCGKPFRTRQGLSGHIQFKHKVQKPSSSKNIIDEFLNIQDILINMKAVGIPQPRINAFALIVAQWSEIKSMCNILNINTNDQDYKNYIITSLARTYQNDDLRKELLSEYNKQLVEMGKDIVEGIGILIVENNKNLISLLKL